MTADHAAEGFTGRLSCWISSCSAWHSGFLRCRLATPSRAIGCEEAAMTFDYSLAAIVTAGLMIYLTYALLRPERF
jgi:K+-transporting ATPase KdpF subunit